MLFWNELEKIVVVFVVLYKIFGVWKLTRKNIVLDNWVLIFHARSGNGKNVLQAWKTRHNNCDIVSQICPCSISDGCLPPNARIECLKSATETLRSPFIDYWDCLKIKKVPSIIWITITKDKFLSLLNNNKINGSNHFI